MEDDWLEAAAEDLIFDSDDELLQRPQRRARLIKERIDHFNDLDDHDFCIRFRLSKRSAVQVLALIEHRLEYAAGEK